MSERVGELIADRYQLTAELGRGGSSVVYRAFDAQEHREVAVKVLHESFAGREDFGVRMVREFRAMRLLAGTAAVQAYGLVASPAGALCLVMELLEGKDLDDHLLRPEVRGRGVSVGELLTLLQPIVRTLERGHELGIVHRDLKPGNIFVLARRWQGEASGEYETRASGADELSRRVRLLDYGFCHAADTRSITPHGTVLGSPSYIAPEVWRGCAGAPDPAIDVYSLGAIVFRLLAGRVPFEAESLKQKLELVCTGERPSLHALRPDLPAAIDDWVAQVLAIQPRHRFSRVRALWVALQEALGQRFELAAAQHGPESSEASGG
ncbi:MAG: serine/threonine protein kinase [Myxococcales bacterium]|nr:serine/threonine protein kinase [Myxococcales bacterium]